MSYSYLPEKLIEIKARQIWEKRQFDGREATAQSDWDKAKEYVEKNQWTIPLWILNQPFVPLEKRIIKPFLVLCKVAFPCICVYLLFVPPIMKLKEDYRLPENNYPPEDLIIDSNGNLTSQGYLLIAEKQKAIREIEIRIEHESRWYELKFLFLGALSIGFFARVIFHSKTFSGNNGQSNKVDLLGIISSPLTLFVLSVVCAVSICMDFYIRSNRIMMHQNGIWIAEFIEPAFMGQEYLKKINKINTNENNDDKNSNIVLGWEQFLRLKGDSHQTNFLVQMTFAARVYLHTILIYTAFLLLLCVNNSNNKNNDHKRVTNISFWIIHFSLFVFAISAHVVPSSYDIIIFNYEQDSTLHYIFVYPSLWAMATFVSYFCVLQCPKIIDTDNSGNNDGLSESNNS